LNELGTPFDQAERWRKRGKKNILEIAHERVKKILEEHRPEPLPEQIQGKLKEIIRRAHKPNDPPR